ncbi:MAG: LamG-like jellyroll fold domain-containing protein [Fuerstiella sp.]
MSDPKLSDQSDDEQIRRVIDQRVSPDEFAAFNERLRTDSEFRRRYIFQADLEADLMEEFNAAKPKLASWPRQQTAMPQQSISWLTASLALALAVTIAWIVADNRNPPKPVQQDIVKPDAESPNAAATVRHQLFVPHHPTLSRDAAVVVRIEGIETSAIQVGTRLSPGILKLTEGEIQLEFIGGAVLALAGPAELHIKSKNAATLLTGFASTRVPPRARGFILNAPDAAIVDLGTEFGVRIDESGTSEVEVTSGEVRLSLLGDDGNTLLSQLVSEAESVRVDGKEKLLVSVKANERQLPKITTAKDTRLSVPDSYVLKVRQQNPLLYWRFEDQQDGKIANEMGPRWAAVMHQDKSNLEGIKIVNGHAHFQTVDGPRYLTTEKQIEGLNTGPYSIEFWMKPSGLNRATCLGLFPDDQAFNHLNVVEIATETELVHDPGAIRFLHRNPPAHSFELGTNVYTQGVCIPGQWQHIVAVRNKTKLELFFNGQLAKRVNIKDANSDDAVKFLVGQLNLFTTMRQFVGAIDEVAIYQHALPPSAIETHYQLIASEINN